MPKDELVEDQVAPTGSNDHDHQFGDAGPNVQLVNKNTDHDVRHSKVKGCQQTVCNYLVARLKLMLAGERPQLMEYEAAGDT